MGDVVIRADGLGKQYHIGSFQGRAGYKTLRETISQFGSRTIRLASRRFATRSGAAGTVSDQTIWALRDVCFEVRAGEALGIIGRNGAGKSTLLKILSRITQPTTGRVEIFGRVGSMLEVGTGFHNELTGRENIYLNGAILGMKRREIDRRFDEIVDFAEIEKFIDTPVKRYSTGMYLRLAFAVAAHLEPDILLVDEVLAVGDAEFQKKCLGKMGHAAQEGRTVLFVSHNLGAIVNLCTRAVLLQEGRLLADGDVATVTSNYMALSEGDSGSVGFNPTESDAFFARASIISAGGSASAEIPVTEGFLVELEYTVRKKLRNLDVAIILHDQHGGKVFTSSLSDMEGAFDTYHQAGSFRARVPIPAEFLTPGVYSFTPVLHELNRKMYDKKDQALQFRVIETGSSRYYHAGQETGPILVKFRWDLAAV